MPKTFHNQTVPGQQEHNDRVALYYLALALCGGAILAVGIAFSLLVYQIAEVFLLAVAVWGLLIGTKKKMAERRKQAKAPGPKLRLLVSDAEERRCVAQAVANGTTFLGWDNKRKPVYWSDQQRTAQTALPGNSGTGKTTLIYNILEQDIKRGLPVIFIDGKGSQDMVADLIEAATKAGRAADVRIIDPSNPSQSNKYNPFYDPRGKIRQRAMLVFDSLPASEGKDTFFPELHKATFTALIQLLSRKERIPSFSSIYRSSQNPDIVRWLTDEIPKIVESDLSAPRYVREALELSAVSLRQFYQQDDWSKLLNGLFNSMFTFVGSEISEIVNSTRDLVSIREVMDRKQILLSTININSNSDYKAIGRMLMRDIQAQIGARNDEAGRAAEIGFVSVAMDEFGLFAHSSFSNLVNTARSANVAMIFSFQSMVQLAGQVGSAFASDVATATNNKFIMRLAESSTVREFAASAGTEEVSEVATQVGTSGGPGGSEFEDLGRGTQRIVERPRITESAIRRLPSGQMEAVLAESRLGPEPTLVHIRYGKRYGIRGEYVPGIPKSYIAVRNKKLEVEPQSQPTFKRRRRQ